MSKHEIDNEMEYIWERIFSDLLNAYQAVERGINWATFVETFRESINKNLDRVRDIDMNSEEEE